MLEPGIDGIGVGRLSSPVLPVAPVEAVILRMHVIDSRRHQALFVQVVRQRAESLGAGLSTRRTERNTSECAAGEISAAAVGLTAHCHRRGTASASSAGIEREHVLVKGTFSGLIRIDV